MPAASSPNGPMIEGVTTSAFRPRQQSGPSPDRLLLSRERSSSELRDAPR